SARISAIPGSAVIRPARSGSISATPFVSVRHEKNQPKPTRAPITEAIEPRQHDSAKILGWETGTEPIVLPLRALTALEWVRPFSPSAESASVYGHSAAAP